MVRNQKKYVSEFKEDHSSNGFVVRQFKPKVVVVKDFKKGDIESIDERQKSIDSGHSDNQKNNEFNRFLRHGGTREAIRSFEQERPKGVNPDFNVINSRQVKNTEINSFDQE